MPMTCCVRECRTRFKKGDGVQFFGFPLKDPSRLAAWTAAINRPNWTPTKASKICSKHFVPSDYLHRPNAYVKYLKDNAVPSVFLTQSSCELSMQQEITDEKTQEKSQENEISNVNYTRESVIIIPIKDSDINTGNQTADNINTESSSINNETREELNPHQSSEPLHIIFLSDPNTETDKSTSCDTLENNTTSLPSSTKRLALRHKIRMLQQKVRRRDRTINSLKLLVEELRREICGCKPSVDKVTKLSGENAIQ